ncbi:hypothetical protein [Acidipila sp. EB88]|uniref:hypothetical protein n=1 Tax=Acidipila sp. EB88 TaxID=2305226 RepID=UPI000F5F55D6|nr:hypothetical protein [Acidipila sp. EB88]RRA49333.1 hypothetical protein D1Y84_14660 [Acidipila sp. EB88]
MGLDAIEIILRAEELFVVSISDDEANDVRTVGDFYRLICGKLSLTALESPGTSAKLPRITQKVKKLSFLETHIPLPPPPAVLPWTSQTVWDAVVAIFVDQLALEPEEILVQARIKQDLKIC